VTVQLRTRDLEALNARLEASAPLDILRWTQATFGGRAAILSSMQRAGSVLCHMADRAGLPYDVLFVDTGVLHPETLATRDALAASHPHLNVVTLTPERSLLEQTEQEGLLYITKEGQERCCDLRKSAPLRAVRGRYDALIAALRRDEGGARRAIRVLELDHEMGALRVHPFAAASREQLEVYEREHPDVVLNPLHRLGFPTIGCYTCTTPVLPDEPERAGRWRHLAGVTYCGINPTDRVAEDRPIELDDAYRSHLA
jgi:phosphoadenosine phosphosulfate reductase